MNLKVIVIIRWFVILFITDVSIYLTTNTVSIHVRYIQCTYVHMWLLKEEELKKKKQKKKRHFLVYQDQFTKKIEEQCRKSQMHCCKCNAAKHVLIK